MKSCPKKTKQNDQRFKKIQTKITKAKCVKNDRGSLVQEPKESIIMRKYVKKQEQHHKSNCIKVKIKLRHVSYDTYYFVLSLHLTIFNFYYNLNKRPSRSERE